MASNSPAETFPKHKLKESWVEHIKYSKFAPGFSGRIGSNRSGSGELFLQESRPLSAYNKYVWYLQGIIPQSGKDREGEEHGSALS
jgi:hypothetical protein